MMAKTGILTENEEAGRENVGFGCPRMIFPRQTPGPTETF